MIRDLKIAYIGGGSRGWAWGLMSDLARAEDISGEVALYDIDINAAKNNEVIGNRIKDLEDCKSVWNYKACEKIEDALKGADFVVISIMPGTFDEMESDVHAPEKYGIYQSVGDTTGPGGIIRALRTIPMFEEIALAIKECCPDAWVINYTNPMAICVGTLYKTFPEIKAFGCCHEVFGTQNLLVQALKEIEGVTDITKKDIKTNVLGVNHFTWITSAQYQKIDLFPVYKKFIEKHPEGIKNTNDDNWVKLVTRTKQLVKFDLFNRYGYIAAAGDRHLAEFCDKEWYLDSPERVDEYGFGLTPVPWRKNEQLPERLERAEKLLSGEQDFVIRATGEEGVDQIRALLGLHDLVTNVNIPNYGQIPNLPLGAIVETNASFRANELKPVVAGNIPDEIYSLISRNVGEQMLVLEAGIERNLDKAFKAFISDPLVNLSLKDAKDLFDEMINNTKKYLTSYDI